MELDPQARGKRKKVRTPKARQGRPRLEGTGKRLNPGLAYGIMQLVIPV